MDKLGYSTSPVAVFAQPTLVLNTRTTTSSMHCMQAVRPKNVSCETSFGGVRPRCHFLEGSAPKLSSGAL